MADALRSTQKSISRKRTLPPIYGESDEHGVYSHVFEMTERVLSNRIINQDKLALINFHTDTDRTGLRSKLWEQFCFSNTTGNFVKCLSKEPGVHIFRIQLLYPRNRQYAFWISPRGNGIDCHRTWEALYLDVIPIVWNSSLNVLYENLPILIINDESQITEDFLREQLLSISAKKKKFLENSSETVYQFEKIRNAYWRRLILSKSRYSQNSSDFWPLHKCWSAKSTILEWARYIPFLKYL